MKIKRIKQGPMDNFVYAASKNGNCFIVDPAWDEKPLERHISRENLKPRFILLTHLHYDHVDKAAYFAKRYSICAHYHKGDEFMLESPLKNAAAVEDEAGIIFEDLKVRVLHTPGHSPGSCCYLAGNDLFTGDTLFVNCCGRTDLPGSSPKEMAESLRRLSRLAPETRVHPGHGYNGEESTIAKELENNPFMRRAAQDSPSSFFR